MQLFKYGLKTDPAVTFFAPWFIRDPKGPQLAGWEFDFTKTRCCNPRVNIDFHHHNCFEGVLVKDKYSQRIWRLTGRVDERGYFEGRWPD